MSTGVTYAGHPLSSQIRASFLEFFGKRGHAVMPSAGIVPDNDPTLMFVNAGMAPFKDVFTGKETRPYTRATSSQKCIRISGKHNDLENVGVTARHHTLFEMLGNFSFGDYFKEEAIAYAWELLTVVWQIPKEKLVITVFGGEGGLEADNEARAIWKKVTGFDDDRIIGLGMKDNFWQMGDTGPCGPCTEIHFFHGENADPKTLTDEPTPDGKGWMEIWNLVFMQYDRSADGKLTPLPKPCVDTGMGLERISAVMQGKTSNYDADLLRALVEKASQIAGKPYGGSMAPDDVSMRVIADHARTAAFLIAEGIFPDKSGREYVLRRVMRRAIRHGHRLGIAKPFLHEVALEVARMMGEAYPELVARKDVIASVCEQEEVRFRQTIDRGLRMLDEEVEQMRAKNSTVIAGDVAFRLYDTFGFPLDLTQVIADERGLTVDAVGYETALSAARKSSEGSKVGDAAVEGVLRELAAKLNKAQEFVGYEVVSEPGVIAGVAVAGKLVESANAGDDVVFVASRTPFYAESGGQVGDTGIVRGQGGLRVRVSNVTKGPQGVFMHHGKVEEGELRTGADVQLEVNNEAREATRRNHSATHLLHWALRATLGDHATQKGSQVGPDRLRFDFSHGAALTADEIIKIEDLVNAKIRLNAPVITDVLPIAEARAKGAVAMFGEKYGDTVRVLTMTPDSVEFCGGTHARALGDIGVFKIASESGVAAGVRRIEALTGAAAIMQMREAEATLGKVARALKAQLGDVVDRAEKLVARERTLEKELTEAKRALAMGGNGGGERDLTEGAFDVQGGKGVAVRVDGLDAAAHRELAEQLRDKLGNSAVLVTSVSSGKVQLVVAVSKAMTSAYKAGDLVKKAASAVGGSGGGRPDMAQAGGPDVAKADDTLKAFRDAFQS